MNEMTQYENVMLGLAIVIPASICLVWMIVEDVRRYRERKKVARTIKEKSCQE